MFLNTAAEWVASAIGALWKSMPSRMTTARMLSVEFTAIWGIRKSFKDEDEYRAAMHSFDQSALCLSGEGIRSAAFSLGVIQALAKRGLLTQFQYLSTVSGGGYIGAWLSRFIYDVEKNADKVQDLLAGEADKPPPELPQIQALRENSNFITPRVGLASTDTWTVIMLCVRNLVLIWLIFVPAMMIVTGIANLYLSMLGAMSELSWPWDPFIGPVTPAGLFLIALAAFLAMAAFATCYYLPTHQPQGEPTQNYRFVHLRAVVPAGIWVVLLPFVIATTYGELKWMIGIVAFSAVMLGYVVAWIITQTKKDLFRTNFLTWASATLVAAVILSTGVWLFDVLTPALCHVAACFDQFPWRIAMLAIFGPLWIVLAHVLLSTVYVGFRRTNFQDDVDREWLGRLSAAKVQPALVWTVFAAVCLLLPTLLFDQTGEGWWADIKRWGTALAGVVSGAVAVVGGKSAFSALDLIATPAERQKALSLDRVVSIATVIFIAFLLALLARADTLLAQIVMRQWTHQLPHYHEEMVGYAIVIAGLVVIVFFSARIDVNQFSLHGIYRNRLVRTFLGDARLKREPNQFTGFDPCDNLRLRELQSAERKTSVANPNVSWRPLFPVINATLNLVDGDNLAWQERMATSFVMTPVACGSASLGRKLDGDERRNRTAAWEGAYINSNRYGGYDVDVGEKVGSDHNVGLSLGTAMTISGAAKSPSQGYHSSPATAFLLTLFNVRLGAWLPNPARAYGDVSRHGPASSLIALKDEMMGLTNDLGENVYLSDGGHFDNLGIYEMIRRRCRFIFVVDAGQDHDCVFEDLGKAVRQTFIDLEAEIEFPSIGIKPRDKATLNSPAFAVGRIRYRESAEPGWLVYMKPTYFIETVPVEVRAYGEANSLFPHESTLDQWFSESQFESYRRLGYFLTMNLGLGKSSEQKTTDAKTVKTLTSKVTRQTAPKTHIGPEKWTETVVSEEMVHATEEVLSQSCARAGVPDHPSLIEFFKNVSHADIAPRPNALPVPAEMEVALARSIGPDEPEPTADAA